MADKELGFVKPSAPNLKEQLARKTLKNVRLQGHTYVDLREDGKRFIFFCTLCLAPCYSEDVLLQHLKGNLHKQRYAAAKATLIGENPWPFNDGVLFFHNSDEEEKDAPSQGYEKNKLLNGHEHSSNLAIVIYSDVSKSVGDGHTNGNEDSRDDCLGDDFQPHDADFANELVIPGVIGKEEVSDLHVRLIGYGKISARISEKDGVHSGIQRLWCEWLGKRGGASNNIHSILPSHDFAIVTFVYYYDLGRQGLFDDIKTLLITGGEDSSNDGGSTKRRKKSTSDSEDVNEALSQQCYSSGEDSQSSSTTTSSALLFHRYDDQILQSRIISNKSLRRQLRKQRRTASEKMCDICQHKMLPGKDVATLLNLTTGRFACSSRNVHGAFHVFHTSCLIHWILLCEHEMFMKPPVLPKVRRRSKRTKSKVNQLETECKADNVVKHKQTRKESEEKTSSDQINSVFCPDCQGTGLHIEGDNLEQPNVPLSEMFKYKIKVSNTHRAWMKDPEVLENCSTGFLFPAQVDDAEGKVAHLKLLQFYRADEESWCQSS
ncbi:uncharacterized protein LOC110685194 [Chenopodium quinoa]|uniref:uncharacterized protein LOC110685194 n=1 Tax=Chenopodium quinoa TaxID=63459 RepID=UPI000B780F6F|nr:uncharacterized protein LOC110685194 [Chenopodium quinoa]